MKNFLSRHAFWNLETKLLAVFRSSHQRCSIRKGVLRNFAKFTGKRLCQSLFFNNVAGLRPAILLKRDFDTGVCFLMNFVKFLKTPFLQNTSGWLLLLHCETFHWCSTLPVVSQYLQLLLFTIFHTRIFQTTEPAFAGVLQNRYF